MEALEFNVDVNNVDLIDLPRYLVIHLKDKIYIDTLSNICKHQHETSPSVNSKTI